LPDLIDDPAWLAGFRHLAPLGLSFDMQVNPIQMCSAAKLASSFPETSIVLNHMGMPLDPGNDGMALWRRGMRLLAAQETSPPRSPDLGMLDSQWTVESIRPLVLEVIEVFGTKRVMFGSNFPVERIRSDLGPLVAALKSITSALTHE